jgi:hypothetical protein
VKKYLVGLLFSLFVFSGCSLAVDLPGPIIDSPFPKHVVVKALYDYAYAWEYHYNDNVYDIVRDVEVQFEGKTADQWGTKGCVRGSFNPNRPNTILVKYISDEEFFIQQTAIWHELTHYILQVLYNDGDYNHVGPGGDWFDSHNELISNLRKDWNMYSADLFWKVD